MILSLIDQAHGAGARLRRICETLGLSVRTLERWRTQPDGGEDRRRGPKNPPPSSLSIEERAQVLAVATSTEFRDLSPKQIVPLLADRGLYLASESSFYRILRQAELLGHREPSRAPIERHRPTSHTAYGPGELWSWDITYLPSSVRGQFYYLYMLEDLYSRKVVGWAVHDGESMELAAALVAKSCAEEGIDPKGLVLHSDNGGPMKGSTMLAMLQRLGIVPSFSRPATSDDNPYSEALFRTLKYRPSYPHRPFRSIEHAQDWVSEFVHWYNDHHLHSALNFVTPSDRHAGLDALIPMRGD